MTAAPAATEHATHVDAAKRRAPRAVIVVVLLTVLAGVYGGYRWYDARHPYEWSGTVEARTIAVGSRVGGRVKDVLVREGDTVMSGQPLVVLETGDLDAQRLMAQAQLEQAQATLEKLEKGARPEEIAQARARAATAAAALEETVTGSRKEEIAAATARLVAAQVAVDKAQVDADRAHKLLASGSVSQAEVDNADAALRGATAQRDAQKKVLEELENGARREEIAQAAARAQEARANEKLVEAGSRIEDLKAAHAAVDAAKGKLDQVEVTISELTIRAPRAARVEALDLRPGDILAPSATAATLIEDGQLYVRIYVPETQLGKLHVGDEVPVSVDSFPGRAFKGQIEHINTVGEYSPRNLQTADERADQVFATRVGLRDGAGDLRAGMAAFIHVPK
jgi:multidrug resistance efflux pump